MNATTWAYAALAWAAKPLLLRKLKKRAQAEPGYAEAVPERFGHYDPPALGRDGRGQWIWVHAVSLGETRAAALLVAALRQAMPGMRLLLTHGTATGRAEGRKLLQAGDVQVWQPWDSRGAVQRFLAQFQPAVGLLMETEVWPNMVAGCRAAGVPLVLTNARLNDKSMQGALRWPSLSRPAYAGLSAVWAQTQADAQRLRTVGATVQQVTGNLKFDVQPDALQLAQGAAWRATSQRPVVMLASAREGEEAMWLAQWQQAQPDSAVRQCQWLIVPRHPQRFDAVHQLLVDAGVRVARRSSWGDGTPPKDVEVWLGDSVGEMTCYYGAAHVALLGGSFAPLGGQNLIEAAACGCPVIMGPHTFNFAQAAQQACDAGAGMRVADMAQAMARAAMLVRSNDAWAQAHQAALQFAQSHRGAAAATARAVVALLEREP